MKKNLKIILPSFLLLVLFISLTVAYASFNESMYISGISLLESHSVQIYGIAYSSSSGTADYSTPTYTYNTITMPVTLGAGASITYDINVYNTTTSTYEISDIDYDSASISYSYSGTGCFLADKLNGQTSYSCKVTLTNTSSSSVNSTVTAKYTYEESSDYTLNHRLELLANGIDTGLVTDIADDRTASNDALTYIGSSPNNYVQYNGELWRIVALDYESSNGTTTEARIKLARASSIGKYVFDVTTSGVNNGLGVADWSHSSLHSLLNGIYYSSGSGNCYKTDGKNTVSTCDFTTDGLDSDTTLLEKVVWHTGAYTSSGGTALEMLAALKGTDTLASGGCTSLLSSSSKCSYSGTLSTSTTDYVGLLSPADFMLATSGDGTSRDNCLSLSGTDTTWSSGSCMTNSWLYDTSGSSWTIQPAIVSNDYSREFTWNKNILQNQAAKKSYVVKPSVYLKPTVIYYGGNGSYDSPYIIDVNDAEGVYKLTFEANGGEGSMSPQIFSAGQAKNLSTNTFTRDGYTFIGWSTTELPDQTSTDKVEYTDGASITLNNHLTLYAVWEKDVTLYDLVESLSKGTASANSISFESITSTTSGSENGNGVYLYNDTGYTDTDGGSENIYYYRGTVDNNLLFADLCWKIVRTTSNGGVKIIYNGTPENGQCNGNTTGMSAIDYSSLDKAYSDSVGYMYTLGEQHGYSTDNLIKKTMQQFYIDNLQGYTSYLEDVAFCNDRSISSGTYASEPTGTIKYNRTTVKTPTLSCSDSNDRFSVGTTLGNGALTLPIASLTADEVVLAGGINGTANSEYYLYSGYGYWTITPKQWDSTKNSTVYRVSSTGNLGSVYASGNDVGLYARPVISLNSEVVYSSGTGTTVDPYTIAPAKNIEYALSYNANGGTGEMGYTLTKAGVEQTLEANSFTREGFHFIGWATTKTGEVAYEDQEIVVLTKDTVLYAVWERDTVNFAYTGTIQSYTVPETGNYLIESWGAQGGTYTGYDHSLNGGYGAYTVGTVSLTEGDIVYVVVGGQGSTTTLGTTGLVSGGYNGGGYAYILNSGLLAAGGGGATHIATKTGLLASLTSDDVIMVAAGGAGSYHYNTHYWGGNSGGGITGGYSQTQANAGTQTSGYAFGKASIDSENALTDANRAGGGGGYYGGIASWGENGAGGGSSYINTTKLITYGGLSPHMEGYITNDNFYSDSKTNTYYMDTSSDAATLTVIAKGSASTATSSYAKEGDGYVKISFIGRTYQ